MIASPAPDWSSLQQRTATGLVMVALAAAVLWLGGWTLTLVLALAAWQMTREWENLRPQGGVFWRLLGTLYAAAPCVSLLLLRNLDYTLSANASLWGTAFPIAIVVATDTGAYFAGKIIGGPKLAPRISPKKTWAGLLGGVSAAACVAVLLQPSIAWPESAWVAAMVGAALGVLGQAGDLLESWLKRIHGVKDSGNLLPGHGGLMDRMDGYVFVLPVYLLLVLCYAEFLP